MKKKQEKSNDLKNLAIVLAVIVLISFSFGVFIKRLSSPQIEKEYSNGFTFTKVSSSKFWSTTILNSKTRQLIEINNLRYSPSEVGSVAVFGNPRAFLQRIIESEANAAYLTYVPEESSSNAAPSYGNSSFVALTYVDLAAFLKKINGINLVLACTMNKTGYCQTAPVITCENQREKSMVIYVKPSNATKLVMENSCLTIEGNGLDLTKAYNKLFFIWYGIL